MPKTLIHLISEQTMQNLLPIMALQPDQVIHICSQDDRFDKAVTKLESAVSVAGLNPSFQIEKLQSRFPEVEDVRQALKSLLRIFPDSVVNITGGTKLMSLGAFLGASEFVDVTVMYCDTDQQQFRSIGQRSLPEEMPSFGSIASKLTLPIIMAAHGKSPESWRDDEFSHEEIAFGVKAFSIRSQNYEIFQRYKWSKNLRDFFRNDRGRIPSSRGKLEALLSANILDAFPEDPPPCVVSFLEAAAAASLVKRAEGGGYCLLEPAEDISLRSHVEKVANILDGSWIELFVLSVVQSAASCVDPRWSVEPLNNEEAEEARDFGETDVVFLKLPRGSLHVVSCKTTLEKPLEHIEALHKRSQNLGGRFAKAMLYVLDASKGQREELMRWGRLLDVKILIGNDIFKEFGVSERLYV
jgi:hypothetical protein